jgi:16S rRNA (uracil1498-N3)-methyltransferase
MSHPLHFFVDCASEDFKVGAKATLSDADFHHLTKVLRVKLNQEITLVCKASGVSAKAIISDLNSKSNCEIIELLKTPEKTNSVTVVLVALCHPATLELIIEKATELGVESILLSHTTYSQLSYEKAVNKSERWQKIIESSAKQSKQSKIPGLKIYESLDKALEEIQTDTLDKFVLSLEENAKSIKQIQFQNKHSVIAIGPEGDFTKDEYKLLKENKFIPLSLGNNTLRSETAVIAGIVTVNVLYKLVHKL